MIRFRWRALIATVNAAWPTWLALGGIAVAFLVAVLVRRALATDLSAGVRYFGTVLQVFGLATVAVGLSQVRRLFGRPSLLKKILTWFRQVGAVFRPPKPITAEMKAGGMAIVGGEARVLHRAGPGTPLDQRVAILEKSLDQLRDEVDANEAKLRKEINTVSEGLGQERRTRERENQQAAARMEELAVGGLHLELVGLVWLVLGVLGASIPDEIARLLCRTVLP